MLESCGERIKLLRAGLDGKTIEQLYIRYNDLKLITASILKEMDWPDKPRNKNACMNLDVQPECAKSLCTEIAV